MRFSIVLLFLCSIVVLFSGAQVQAFGDRRFKRTGLSIESEESETETDTSQNHGVEQTGRTFHQHTPDRCYLEPDTGNMAAAVSPQYRYHYNQFMAKCERHTYYGSRRLDRSKNEFRRLQDCLRVCVDTTPPVNAHSGPCATMRCAECYKCLHVTTEHGEVVGKCVRKRSCCPGSQSPVQCFVDPCQTTSCADEERAHCIADYCGGCHAHFYDRYWNSICRGQGNA